MTEILYDGDSSFKDLDLHQEWTAALAELGKVSEIVQVSEAGAPKMTVRTLARMSSDPDTDLATQRATAAKENARLGMHHHQPRHCESGRGKNRILSV